MREPKGLRLCPYAAVFCMIFPVVTWGSDFDVVVNEIHYNPLSGQADDEFLELFNRGPTRVDLGGWSIVEGISLSFPPGTGIEPQEYLLVSPDPDHTRVRYGVDPVVGPYSGRLDNGGEIVTLVNAEGEIVSRVHYEDARGWPTLADGLGPALELVDPHAPPEIPRSWAASLAVDGTPGAVNSTLRKQPQRDEIVIIETNEVWRYRKGTEEYPQGWKFPGFDDAAWESGPTGIGYADGDDRTVLDDMLGGYISFAARRAFAVLPQTLESLGPVVLEMDYDDGFVAYLNGEEVARAELGNPGEDVPFDLDAGNHEAGTPESFVVPISALIAGENVLAVQVHNDQLGSSDASFIPRLYGLPAAEEPSARKERPVCINEIRGSEAGVDGFIELHNRSDEEQSIGGSWILDSRGTRFSVPEPTQIPPRGHIVFLDAQLGFDVQLAGVTYALVEPDGRTFVDALDPHAAPTGEPGLSFGRFPDGGGAGFLLRTVTREAANQLELPTEVLVNEIYYHPPYVPPDGDCESKCSDAEQWIELHNRSAGEVDLSRWRLANAIDFDFPSGAKVPPRGYLIIASSRERFLALHPAIVPSIVFGDWRRNLAHDTETIDLRDELDNLVGRVHYGDGSPQNDLEPRDGEDDRTFRSSEWPRESQGSGRTIELIHPELDNGHGAAWTEGPVGGTPAAANGAYDPSPAPVVAAIRNVPAIPRSSEPVVVTCDISAAGTVAEVRVLWHRDGGGDSGAVLLRDDGQSGDGEAGDGRYGGEIPPQPDQTVIAFRVEARLTSGEAVVVPRPPEVDPYDGFQGPYYLYQVLNVPPPANASVNYYLVMTEADLDELEDRDIWSDVLLYATFVYRPEGGEDVVHHLAGIRYRGEHTRSESRKSYRLDFPPNAPFLGNEHLSLNATDIDNEMLVSDLFRRAGLPGPLEWTVNLTFNGDLDTRYIRKEHIDKDFLFRYFGSASDGGNLYRAYDPPELPSEGDLTYFGEDPEDYRPYYSKRTNREPDDFSDVIELCRVFDPNETPDDEFPERVLELVDVRQWARYMAVQSCVSNGDGAIHSRTGEDFFLYRVPMESDRPDAGRWILVPWDIEETFEDETEPVFSCVTNSRAVEAIRRFFRHPRFAPLYYCNLINLRHGAFSRGEMRQRLPLVDFLFGESTIDGFDAYVTARNGFYDENVPMHLSAGSVESGGEELIGEGDAWRYFKGESEPSGGSLAWADPQFDDTDWDLGPSGFGYGDGDDGTELLDMRDNYTTVYIRKTFEIPDPGGVGDLELVVDYDDGFVAYLNGTEVERANLGDPGVPVPFDALADGNHEAGTPETFDITRFANELVAGTNVVAVQGANVGIGSGDLSLIPTLVVHGGASTGCGQLVHTTAGVIGLEGRYHACETRGVLVNGEPADIDPVAARWSASVAVDSGDSEVSVVALDESGEAFETMELLIRRFSNGAGNVEGALNEDTTWSQADGPYLLRSDVVVARGVTLRIGAGVVVFAEENASIIVRGRLLAEGTEEAPVLLRAGSCGDRWGGVVLDTTGTGATDPVHTLRYCDIRDGDSPDGHPGCVTSVGAKVIVDRCQFRFLTATAIHGTDAHVEVRESEFSSIQGGIRCTDSTAVIVACAFQDMVGDNDAVRLQGNGNERSLVESCTFLDTSDDAIEIASASVDIRDNLFMNAQDNAISLDDRGSLGPTTITGNIVYSCATAIALTNGDPAQPTQGHNNTLVGNQEGLALFASGGSSIGGQAVFHSMIVWSNISDLLFDPASALALTFSNVSQELWPGEGNISADPFLQDVSQLDFSLRSGSPCINSGDPDRAPDPDGSRADMGAVPFTGDTGLFVRGDVNADGSLQLTDAIVTLEHLFRAAPGPLCQDRLDANDDSWVDISDPIYTLLFLFLGGGPPPPPFPGPGTDPTPDELPCD